MDAITWLVIAVLIQAFLLAFLFFLGLFEPALAYEVTRPIPGDLTGEPFVRLMEVLGNTHVDRGTSIEVLPNGDLFYEVELETIRRAQHTVHVEAYILYRSRIGQRFVDALTERARAGVRVRLIIDAVGSHSTPNRYFRELRAAGGEVYWYHPLRWHTWPRYNNRTHRELIVIDSQVAFVGGAGIADQWMFATRRGARWRDTMFRVDGPAVASLESTFAENWVEASGQLLTDVRPATGSALDIPRPRPAHQHEGRIPALVIDSSPTQGRSTRARMVFQALIASARRRIFITTPYFLPDRSLRREIIRAMCERRVEVVILTAGRKSDQLLTRRSSRRIYGELLQAGARIYEYEPAMMHAKTIVVDGVWSLIGSTNLDPRSFCLNDEINIAALDTDLATRLEADFAADVASSRVVTLQAWRRRPAFERLHEWLGWALERQQ